ncbi:hypothetical protein ACIBG5_16555 [Kribbella sp. NPDC050241]|uniref:hypothetical protein n=1 Tax=Kribbella sp. NPDC050241 TaxID=3364115 RepID=UPI0037AB3DB2
MPPRPRARIHTFVDENKTRGLLMAAASCPASAVSINRRTLAGLLMPGQRRIHFQKESPARQRKILAAITELDTATNLYATPRADVESRRRCLTAIVRDAARTGERLVVERDESTLDFDRQTLYHAVRIYDCVETLQYELLAPHLDPLLWIPDALVWAWAKGGEWREQVRESCTTRPV